MSNPAADISYYADEDGAIHRVVRKDLGLGVPVETSDVVVSPDLKTFRLAHPGIRVTTQAQEAIEAPAPASAPTLREMIEGVSDDELAALGLTRAGADDEGDDDLEVDLLENEKQILAGFRNVGELGTFLDSVDDVGALETLRAAEEQSSNRISWVNAISDRIDDLNESDEE